MKQIGIRQARQELPALIDQVEAGEEISITRLGKVVARLVAVSSALKPLPPLTAFRNSMGRAGTPAAKLLREERDAR